MKKSLRLSFMLFVSLYCLTQTSYSQSIGLNPNATTVCSGTQVTLTALNAPSGAVNYYWYFSDNSYGYYGTSVTSHSYYYNGYNTSPYVALYFYDANWNYLGETYQYLTIKAGSDGYFSMSPWSACPNAPVSFNYWNNNNNATAYTWFFGDGTSSAGSLSAVHSYSVSGYYNIKLAVTTSGGCGTDTMNNWIWIDNSVMPDSYFYYSSTSGYYCPGQPINFYPYETSGVSYNWNFGDGVTTNSVSPTHSFGAEGNYNVTYTITNSCGNSSSSSYSVSIYKSDVNFSGNSLGVNSPACPNDNVSMWVNWGSYSSPDYFVWNFGDGSPVIKTGNSSQSHTYPSANQYTITVQVFDGCDDTTLTSVVDVNTNVPITWGYVYGSWNSLCPGQNYAFTADPWGMKSYTWNFGDGSPSETTSDRYAYHSFSAPGSYTVSLALANNCNQTYSVSTVQSVSSSGVFPMGMSVNTNSWMGSCPGDEVGFEVNGGGGMYGGGSNAFKSYLWHFGDGTATKITTEGKVSHTYSAAGMYSASVTVTNYCGKDTTLTLFSPVNVSTGIAPPSWVGSSVSPREICTGGEAEIQFNYVDGYSSYLFDFGDGSTQLSDEPRARHIYSSAGYYNVTMIITNGCNQTSASYAYPNVYNDAQIDTWSTEIQGPASACPGNLVAFNVSGTGYNSVEWNFGDGTVLTATNWQVTHAYTTNGVYNVSAKIMTDCDSLTVYSTININNNSTISNIYIPSPEPSCPGDAVYLAVAELPNPSWWMGGGGNNNAPNNYMYDWSFGDGSSEQTVGTGVSHLYGATGVYNVTVVVTNACGNSKTVVGVVTIINNAVPDFGDREDGGGWGVAGGSSIVGCKNDAVLFYMSGEGSNRWNFGDGTAPVSATEVVTTEYGTALVITHKFESSGTKWVKLTKTNNCGISATDSIAVVVGTDAAVSGGVFIESPSNGMSHTTCSAVQFHSTGGVSYSWNFGDGTSQTTTTPGTSHNYSSAGTYYISVKVTNGCGNSATYTDAVTVSGSSGGLVEVSASATNVSCNGGSNGTASATATGGQAPYTYSWSTTPVQANSTATGLPAGVYVVTVTESNGCSGSANVTITQPSALSVETYSINPSACGTASGSAYVTAGGGTAPYTYSWSNGSTGTYAANLVFGSYKVTAKSANGCTKTASFHISETGGAAVAGSATNLTCNGASTGAIDITASGGTAPYAYSWSNGSTAEDLSGLSEGTYVVTVTTANNCRTVKSADITEPEAIAIASTTEEADCGVANGSAEVIVTGGTSPYTYSWNTIPAKTTRTITGLTAKIYVVTVTDASGCIQQENVPVSNVNAPVVIVNKTDVTCNGLSNGIIDLNVSGGTSPYSFLWVGDGFYIDEDISGLSGGKYSYLITDAFQCKSTGNVTISEPEALTASAEVTSTICNKNSGSIAVEVSGGNPGYTYVWTNSSDTDSIAGNLAPGTYSVTVTDSKGCTAKAAGVVTTGAAEQEICVVTVDPVSNKNVVVWEKTGDLSIKEYNIYVETTSGVFMKQGTVAFSSMSIYQDNSSKPVTRSYRYKVSAVDSCGNESDLSSPHKTMHLTASVGTPSPSMNLVWENYEGIEYGQFRIWKGTTADNAVPIDSVPSNIFTYTDPNTSGNSDSLYYFMEVIAEIPCVASEKTSAASNYNSAKSNTSIAFNPNGPDGIKDGGSLNNKLSVYPNPTGGSITMNLLVTKQQHIAVRVFDTKGQLLYSESLSNQLQGYLQKSIDLSAYPKGIYHLQVVADEGISNSKIILE